MADRSADRAPVAGLEVADMGQRRGDDGKGGIEFRPVGQIALGDRRPDGNGISLVFDMRQFREAADVHENFRPDKPHVEHRHQRLAAGQHAGLVAMFGEHHDGVFDAPGAHIVERRRLHALPPTRRRSRPDSPPDGDGPASPPASRIRPRRKRSMSCRAAPRTMRPPTAATLPDSSTA